MKCVCIGCASLLITSCHSAIIEFLEFSLKQENCTTFIYQPREPFRIELEISSQVNKILDFTFANICRPKIFQVLFQVI